MTYQGLLFAYRSVIIGWVTWSVLPLEMLFDAVETEIQRVSNV